ncbi:MAG: alpha/beta hydrolase [Pirellulales bacterium]|nr:alpha/beta hydrolase [Pirellulales bacterium]
MSILNASAHAVDAPVTKSFVYKETPQAALKLFVHYPPGWQASDSRPGIVFFFGGGWQRGNVEQFARQAEYLASRGMIAARADYRVKSRHDVSPRDCVLDARAALAWFRSHATELGVDPGKIVASGGSAGGHLAACTALGPKLDGEPDADQAAYRPNALVLFNPALRFDGVPRLMERIGGDEGVGKAISPTLNLDRTSPPTMILYGTADQLYAQGKEFAERAKPLGVRVEMFTADDQPHGFFNRPPWTDRTLLAVDKFLASLGYLEGEPTIAER